MEENELDLISVKELMDTILGIIESDKLDEIIQAYNHADDPVFRNGFMAGMAMSGMLTGNCHKYVVKKLIDEKDGSEETADE